MKKFLFFLGVLIVLFVFMAHFSHAAGIPPDSTVSSGGSGIDLDVGVPDYPDSFYYECSSASSDCSTLISSTTPYTILSFAAYGSVGASSLANAVSCGGSDLPLGWFEDSDAQTFDYVYSFVNDGQFHCSASLQVNAADQSSYYFVQYVPYDTRVVDADVGNVSSSTPYYTQDAGDIKFGLAILMVLGGLIFMGLLFNSTSFFSIRKKS